VRNERLREAERPIDSIDLALLHALQADARAPIATLCEAAGVSRATTYARLTKMREEGVIQALTVAVDPRRVGLPVTAIVLLRTTPDPSRKPDPSRRWSRIPILEAMPEVEFVADLAGEFDLLVLLRLRDNEHLSEFVSVDIRRVPGIATTRTLLVLNEAPRRSLVLPPLEPPGSAK
jgi:DNA-binding Lrp family transcriptional regulator